MWRRAVRVGEGEEGRSGRQGQNEAREAMDRGGSKHIPAVGADAWQRQNQSMEVPRVLNLRT